MGESPLFSKGDVGNRRIEISYSDFQGLSVLGNNPDSTDDPGAADFIVGYGNLETNPHFINPVGQDQVSGTEDDCLSLTSGSPVIDAAANSALPFDIDGDGMSDRDLDVLGSPRFVDDPNTTDTGKTDGTLPVVDMGAFEFNIGDGPNAGCN